MLKSFYRIYRLDKHTNTSGLKTLRGKQNDTTIIIFVLLLYCIVLYCVVLYCIVLYCVVLYFILLYCILLYCIALYCIVLHCIVFYCIKYILIDGFNGLVHLRVSLLQLLICFPSNGHCSLRRQDVKVLAYYSYVSFSSHMDIG